MKSKKVLLGISLLTLFLAAILSCDKIKDQNVDPQSGKDYVTAESTYSNVYKTVSDAIQKNNLMKSGQEVNDSKSCPDITLTGDYPSKTLTIAFDPTVGCDIEGVNFKGTVTAVMTGPFKTSGTFITVSFSNFYVNDNKVEGEKTITNMGRNGSNQLMVKVEIKNGHITTKNGGNIYYATTKTWTWLAGESTAYPTLDDDIWQLEGTANGTNLDGKTFTANITTPIKILIQGCYVTKKTEAVSGVVEVDPSEGKTITLDYGDGTCDGKATLKVGDLADIIITLI